jgi:hypothetical protein
MVSTKMPFLIESGFNRRNSVFAGQVADVKLLFWAGFVAIWRHWIGQV